MIFSTGARSSPSSFNTTGVILSELAAFLGFRFFNQSRMFTGKHDFQFERYCSILLADLHSNSW